MIRAVRRLALAHLYLVVCLVVACSSGDGTRQQPIAPPKIPGSQHTFKVLRNAGNGDVKELDFVPKEIINAVVGAGNPNVLGKIEVGGNTNGTDTASSTATGVTKVLADPSQIVQAAAAECGITREP
jgi:hypothetical protein